MRRAILHALGYVIALAVLLWRKTCRRRIVDDPRPALRAANKPYVYAMLHAHQAAAVLLNDEPLLAAMVSRSADGELLLPSLRLRGVEPVRGSTRRAGVDKGGSEALSALALRVRDGTPALLAVDGPRGPRGYVHRGIVALARETGAVILPVAALAKRRSYLGRTWDRFELPRPFTRLALHFAEPVEPGGERDELRVRGEVARSLAELERRAAAS